MEKIKFEGEVSTAELSSACANKINEIIDELKTIRIERTNIDTITKEDRLKTLENQVDITKHIVKVDAEIMGELEDKIEFIMKNGAGLKEVILKSGSETLSHYETAPLQDLWDEQHWDRLEAIKKVYTQEVKDEACNCSDDDMCKCKRQIIKPSVTQDKIEEIISAVKNLSREVRNNREDLASWLRDKLKGL